MPVTVRVRFEPAQPAQAQKKSEEAMVQTRLVLIHFQTETVSAAWSENLHARAPRTKMVMAGRFARQTAEAAASSAH
jgi:hypothetical protein